jgi:hypothetical protein
MPVEFIPDWKKDLLDEKSIWQIYQKAENVVGNERDRHIVLGVSAITLLTIFVVRGTDSNLTSSALAIDLAHSWSELSVAFAASILGFLIAGFAIFATATTPELLKTLAQIKQDGREISDLKFVYFNFLYIFIHYVVYISIALLAYFSTEAGSPVLWLGAVLHDQIPAVIDIAAACGCAIIAVYTAFAVLLLKGFIWNLYRAIIFALIAD